jgi:hypothetical protein
MGDRMTLTLDGPLDLVDELEAKSIAARFTCPACGRIKCKCGRTQPDPEVKPAKASTISTDLVDDDPAMTLDEWVEQHRHNPINLATLPTTSPAGPWYSDRPPDVGDDWPHGVASSPHTPGFHADPGQPNARQRAAIRKRWR